MTPVLYVKLGCPWCEEVEAYLTQRQIAYERRVVSGNEVAFREMFTLSGQSKAPVLNWEDEILADFGVDELVPFLKARGVV